MDQYIVVFLWLGGGGLVFEIEMFLFVYDDLICQVVFGFCNGWGWVVFGLDGWCVFKLVVCGESGVIVQQGCGGIIVDFGFMCGVVGCVM